MGKKGKRNGEKSHERETVGAEKYLKEIETGDGWDNRHALYQRAVQSPKGDISYLTKFFLLYVGGRVPLHLREDFCGTALICTEWLRADSRRTATGLDLDDDALAWGIRHNLSKMPQGGLGRICLLLGNVLNSASHARLFSTAELQSETRDSVREGLSSGEMAPDFCATTDLNGSVEKDVEGERGMSGRTEEVEEGSEESAEEAQELGSGERNEGEDGAMETVQDTRRLQLRELQTLPADIICAFNFSTCCLHTRRELMVYLRHVRGSLSGGGGVFAMDLYGGMSSECPLKLKRRFGDFTYTWEQEEFDAVTRMTRISLHFRLESSKMTIRKAFSYKWRLWTIAEAKECLEEAGFKKVFVWMRTMPDLQCRESEEDEIEVDKNSKYEETNRFLQCDAWNAYVVGVA